MDRSVTTPQDDSIDLPAVLIDEPINIPGLFGSASDDRQTMSIKPFQTRHDLRLTSSAVFVQDKECAMG
jgi:hypothetical protein